MQKIEAIRLNPEILKQEKARRARNNFMNFITYTKPDYQANWHHRNLANILDKFAKKEIKRLMVFMPPRHGKSEQTSRRLPAYIFGINPDAKIIATSYSATLAESMSKDVQRIIDSPTYNELFPETTLMGSPFVKQDRKKIGYTRTNERFDIVGHNGYYLAAGVGGGITGFGADYALIDDPIKNRQEAESKTYRDMVYDWFASTLYTRLEKDACILLTMTRWHEDDLAGRLLTLAKNDPFADQWYVICYPAIYDEKMKFLSEDDPRQHGEALWRDKYDENQLRKMKATIGSYEWNALYQQTPSPPRGAIIQREWLKYYKVLPSRFDRIIQSWDFAFDNKEQSSYVVGQVWGKIGSEKYLIDQVRDKMSFTESIRALRLMTAKYPMAKAKLIEKKANGPAIINAMKKEISGLIPIDPKASKEERLNAVSPEFEAGNIYIPEATKAKWVGDYVEELVSFPNSMNNDQVDATTQALLYFDRENQNKPVVIARTY